MAKVLVVDDEDAFREGLIETLTDLGRSAQGVSSVAEALDVLSENKFDLILLDYQMPGTNGLEAIPLIKKRTSAPIIVVTAHLEGENAITAMKLGAYDHLTKPIGRKDIASVFDQLPSLSPASEIEAKPKTEVSSQFIGQSPAMREVFKMIGRLALADTSVLITGETGTGKEVVAKAIHTNSAVGIGPFVAVNCAAIPEALLESELFGHAKGAFTGAVADRKGSFQQADGGTLFLDEVGDMPLILQAKLLRALQERAIVPVGSSKAVPIHARFVAATHQNLAALVKSGKFREDLYYRLNVMELHLPPLRDREGDIGLLAKFFLAQLGGEKRSLSAEALAKLSTHSWPGNVRELRNVIERALVVTRSEMIGAADIRFLDAADADPTEVLDLPQAVARLERIMISEALRQADGNRSEAARRLGISRPLLYSKLKEHLIDL